jgi:7-carboxy-7-deazaguanine synthase
VKETDYKDGMKLPVAEEFYSIQGEGYHTGKAAYFIRIAGCNLRCSWCDSQITWDAGIHPMVDIATIGSRVRATPAKSIVVTGGEPTLYNLNPLSNMLKAGDITTFFETSGTGELTGTWDWLCLSPKQYKPPKDIFYQVADELKVVICEEKDLEWAESAAKHVGSDCQLYLQPEWSQFSTMIHTVVDYAKTFPKWNVSLQAHKFMHIP